MPVATNVRQAIANALAGFGSKPLAPAATALLESLGYKSQRRFPLRPNTAENFVATFGKNRPLNPQRARLAEWQSVDFLFQLTDAEVRASAGAAAEFQFEASRPWNGSEVNSFLFLAIALTKPQYNRTQLAGITRAVNRLFDMPVIVLFRHGDTLTLAIIPHRLHKRDPAKDVLEKVTLIKDIRFANPHRAHIEILCDLSFAELREKHKFSNFVELQTAWQKTLDSSQLNKHFYHELANWYFWACDHVTFPMPKGTPNPDAYKAQSLIRLITRLIFCWFVKEKGLIPGELFDPRALAKLLKHFDGGTGISACADQKRQTGMSVPHSIYYKAILQNLFFATLNQEMGKREFRKRNAQGRDPHRGITNLYRYEDYFADPRAFLELMRGIPFLNGGLFECLDKVYRAEENQPDVRIDGFSDHPKNPLSVPDFLFFGDERAVDLSAAYGEARFRQVKARGLIHIFNHYKFTVAENTPIEEEIALDPELAGKVFENLLAAYNPETATTARKQTGSFYTPREIVDYMVDEALMAYLETALANGGPRSVVADAPKTDATERVPPNTEARLQRLLSWEDTGHDFTPQEVERLIAAIDHLKALDPACGSGAFPMGLLHKLVFILGKLDPHNEQWKQQQIAKASEIPDATVREKTLADIEQAFAANELDYGRKLYLIENCIYGVDIQPIAVQIAKMRFFISLIVDQTPVVGRDGPPGRPHPNDLGAPGGRALPDNLGIRPLPNLETKFVAANTLIGIEKPQQQMLRNPQIDAKEAELRRVRERHFTARTPATKARCREQDAKLRAEISELLRADGFARETTEKLANWNPYDQNASADFFDPEWMFGIKHGFHVVIGNPPYVRVDELRRVDKDAYRRIYTCTTGKYDLYYLFIEHGLRILTARGSLCFITPNKFCAATSGAMLRALIFARSRAGEIVSTSKLGVFEQAANYPVIAHYRVGSGDGSFLVREAMGIDSIRQSSSKTYELPIHGFRMLPESIIPINVSQAEIDLAIRLLQQGTALGSAFSISEGLRLPAAYEREQPSDFMIVKQFQFEKWTKIRPGAYISERDLKRVVSTQSERFIKITSPKIVIAEDALEITATVDEDTCVPQGGVYFGVVTDDQVELPFVLGLLNSRLVSRIYEILFGGMHMGGGYLRYRTNFLEALPIPKHNSAEQSKIAVLVKRILAAKRANPQADTSAWEREIDERVYRLYGLTAAEIKIVEDGAKR